MSRPVTLTNSWSDSPMMIDADQVEAVNVDATDTVICLRSGTQLRARDAYDDVLRLIGWAEPAEPYVRASPGDAPYAL